MSLDLAPWESFYLTTGGAGAALTGIMFVVIALASERLTNEPSTGLTAFSTPTVGHFSIALLVSATMTVPVHTPLSLAICLGGCALVGVWAIARGGILMRRMDSYTADPDDWTWHVILPFLAYAMLLAAAGALASAERLALVLVAIAVPALLVIGIHNAWDVAVFLVVANATGSVAAAVTALNAPPRQAAPTLPAPPASAPTAPSAATAATAASAPSAPSVPVAPPPA